MKQDLVTETRQSHFCKSFVLSNSVLVIDSKCESKVQVSTANYMDIYINNFFLSKPAFKDAGRYI